MNRRESLKALGITGLSATVLVEACKDKTNSKEAATSGPATNDANADRLPNEVERDNALVKNKFFTTEELATITVLADIIIPKDEKSGSASDAGVPAFIDFIVQDMPDHQVPMRGGLRWLDITCLKRHEKSFIDCSKEQQLQLVDEIAYPTLAKPDMQQGVTFFNRMRSLTASGFFSSKIGMEDVGYVGNRPNKWEGVPADDIKKYGLEDVKFG
ncbi:MAG TPA: gluconate 2-dehydrogenase subunit 3 family protein [Parafilimonas sp.]|nr:gluconate 2-dehydrogenase subunit 3 family protein [Parafilimonas sp.]